MIRTYVERLMTVTVIVAVCSGLYAVTGQARFMPAGDNAENNGGKDDDR